MIFRIFLVILSVLSVAAASAQTTVITNERCYDLNAGEIVGITTEGSQAQEFSLITRALGKVEALALKSASLRTFKYYGNSGASAVLTVELANGMKYDVYGINSTPVNSNKFTVEDDGGSFALMPSASGLILVLDKRSARADLVISDDERRQVEVATRLVFEAGTGSITVPEAQTASFSPVLCK